MMLALLALSVGSLFVLHLVSEQADARRASATTPRSSRPRSRSRRSSRAAARTCRRPCRPTRTSCASWGCATCRSPTPRRRWCRPRPTRRNVGKKLARRRGPAEFVIRGVLGDDTPRRPAHHLEPPGPDRGRRPARRLRGDHAHPRRLLGALEDRVREPRGRHDGGLRARHAAVALPRLRRHAARSQSLTDAARRVAAGDLSARVPRGGRRRGRRAGAHLQPDGGAARREPRTRGAAARRRALDRDGPLRLGARPRDPQPAELDQPHDRLRAQAARSRRGAAALRVRGADGEPEERGRRGSTGWSATSCAPASRRGSIRARATCGQVVRETAALVEHKAIDQAIGIELEVDEALPTTLADPELLKTCLLNLVLNAFEAMPDGGRAAARRAARARERADPGSGPRHRRRADAGRRRARARALLLDQGGRRRPRAPARQADRRGPRRHDHARLDARARYHGPAAAPAALARGRCPSRRRRAPAREAARAGRRRRAAPARDPAADPGLGGLRGRHRGERQERPRRAAAGRRFDVVLTDLKMPDHSGISLLEEILREQPGACVVLMTAHGTIDSAVEAMRKGAFDYLTKPLDREVLLLAVSRAVERTRLVSENRQAARGAARTLPAREHRGRARQHGGGLPRSCTRSRARPRPC